MADLTEALKKKETARQTRTERELQRLEAPPASKTKTAPPKKVQHTESIGVGRDLLSETTRVILKGIDARLKALKDRGATPQQLAELEMRRKLILEEAERARQ